MMWIIEPISCFWLDKWSCLWPNFLLSKKKNRCTGNNNSINSRIFSTPETYKYVENALLRPVQFPPQEVNKFHFPWAHFGVPLGDFPQNLHESKVTWKQKKHEQHKKMTNTNHKSSPTLSPSSWWFFLSTFKLKCYFSLTFQIYHLIQVLALIFTKISFPFIN